jgi:hypothetical protein
MPVSYNRRMERKRSNPKLIAVLIAVGIVGLIVASVLILREPPEARLGEVARMIVVIGWGMLGFYLIDRLSAYLKRR